MEREIKFKAWHKGEKRFYDVVSLGIYGQIRKHALLDVYSEQAEDGDAPLKMVQNHEVALLQFSGVVDRNGVEVFEGFKVKIPDDYDTYGMMAGEAREVYFAHGGFRLKPFNSNQKGHWLEDGEDVEVIGHIFEGE